MDEIAATTEIQSFEINTQLDRNQVFSVEKKPNHKSGPSCAHFVFISASKEEIMETKKKDLRAYSLGEKYWKPYFSDETDKDNAKDIGVTSQNISGEENIHYHSLSLSDLAKHDLIFKIMEYQNKNELVIIVIDMWSILLEKYMKIVAPYDSFDSYNCAVVTPDNCNIDSETQKNLPKLMGHFKEIFKAKTSGDKTYFRYDIHTLNDFENELKDILCRVQSRIAETSQPRRTIPPSNRGHVSKPRI